jgi:hypothetical protein
MKISPQKPKVLFDEGGEVSSLLFVSLRILLTHPYEQMRFVEPVCGVEGEW